MLELLFLEMFRSQTAILISPILAIAKALKSEYSEAYEKQVLLVQLKISFYGKHLRA